MGVEVWQGLEEKVKNILEEPTPEGEVEIVTRYEKCGCVTTFLAKDIDEKDRKSLREIKCSEHKAPTPKECESEERFLATLPPEKQGYCSDSPYCDHGSCEELRQSA